MVDETQLDVRCLDYLRDNRHLYAHKARRKKIALILVEATNRSLGGLELKLGEAKLLMDEHTFDVQPPQTILRKFSEFTWDFALYSILDFHPWLTLLDAGVFLFGPLYNRRLKKQLQLLSDGERTLSSGESAKAILGFRCAVREGIRLQLPFELDDRAARQKICEVS